LKNENVFHMIKNIIPTEEINNSQRLNELFFSILILI